MRIIFDVFNVLLIGAAVAAVAFTVLWLLLTANGANPFL